MLQTIFGLSIDEKVQWATALTDGAGGLDFDSIRVRSFDNMAISDLAKTELNLEEKLAEALENRELAAIFKSCAAVGISTIGVVHPEKKCLLSIALKNWFPNKSDEYLVDFDNLFRKRIAKNAQLTVR